MRENLGRWLARRAESTVAGFQAAAVGVLAWFGAALGVWLSGKTEKQFLIVSISGIVFVTIISFFARSAIRLRLMFTSQRASSIAFVHSQLDDLVSTEQSCVESNTGVLEVPGTPLTTIANLVKALYDLLESKYQDTSVPGERIYIEACFMARSYIDGRVTISAWANNEGRKPTSLSMRPTQPDIYDRTVTADLFREAERKRPEPRLIEDTASDSSYHHLYPTQHQRIRSTIVYPVLSSSSKLLGTLVVTADRPRYFGYNDRAFWFSLMNLYERRIALEFLRLDAAVARQALPAPF